VAYSWPRLSKSISLRVIVVAIAIVVFCATCVYFIIHVRASFLYHVTAVYDRMPADDRLLEKWLKSQPGIVEHTVHTERAGHALHVRFIMSRTLFGSPPFPDLSRACDGLGYGPLSSWNDDDWSNKGDILVYSPLK